MIKKKLFLYFFILFSVTFFAQKINDSLFFGINFKWRTQPFKLNQNYISKKDTLLINLMKFYISGIEINYANGTFFREKNSYHLINIENFKTFSISKFENKTISNIVFNIGVDSSASVSGANSGDLDLQNGMYWAWQSGYINIKIEGNSNSCKTRKNAFQFHIGGYLKPNYAMRKIEIPILKTQIPNREINVVMDLEKLFSEIALKETNLIMIPGKEAMKMADLTAKIFSIE